MKTIYTQDQLKQAIEEREQRICVRGSLASQFISEKKRKMKKNLMMSIALLGACIFAVPFTGGVTAYGIPAGVTGLGLTVGTVTISTAELCILCGSILGVCGIISGAKVEVYKDHIILTPKYKA